MQNAFQWGNISISMEQNVIGFTGNVFVYPYYLLPQHLLWKNIDSNAPFSSDEYIWWRIASTSLFPIGWSHLMSLDCAKLKTSICIFPIIHLVAISRCVFLLVEGLLMKLVLSNSFLQLHNVDCCVSHLVMLQQRQQMRCLQLSAHHRGGGRCCLRWSWLYSSSPPLMLPLGCPELFDAAVPPPLPPQHTTVLQSAPGERQSNLGWKRWMLCLTLSLAKVPLGTKTCFVYMNRRTLLEEVAASWC